MSYRRFYYMLIYRTTFLKRFCKLCKNQPTVTRRTIEWTKVRSIISNQIPYPESPLPVCPRTNGQNQLKLCEHYNKTARGLSDLPSFPQNRSASVLGRTSSSSSSTLFRHISPVSLSWDSFKCERVTFR